MPQGDSVRRGSSELGRRAAVCFIIPPSAFLLDERVFMSLGVLKVAASCEEAGYPVEVLDLSGVENYLEALEAHLRNTGARYFGLTSTTPQMPAATRIIRRIRALRPDARVILGGPHPTLVHAAARRERKLIIDGRASAFLQQLHSLVDVVVAGDGEFAIFQALDDTSPALVDADDPRSHLFLTSEQLEMTPFPARHLVDVESYHYEIEGKRATSLIAQLGCPFNCGFCGGRQSPMLRRIRQRSTHSVIQELEYLHREYGFNGFMFYDDELNVNKQIVELMDAIADLQQRLGTEFRLRGFVKSELLTAEQADALHRAGFRWLLVGFESGSPRILKNINKKASREDNTRCVEIAHDHGLKVKALMSIGHPGESEETVEATRQWLLEVQPQDFDVTIITTYPGTPYFDHAEPHAELPGIWVYTYPQTGDRLYAVELDYTETPDYYKGDPDGGYRAFVYTDDLSQERLVELRDSVERDVRARLAIPYPASASKVNFEHSMGQMGALPPSILRSSKKSRSDRDSSITTG